MSNHEELFIRYLDEQLSDEERNKFENMLENDQELNSSFAEFKKVRDLFSSSANPELNNDYFKQVIPEFRKNLNEGKSPIFYRRYQLAFTTLILVITSFFIADKLFINNNQPVTIESVVIDLTEDELNEIADYYFNDNLTGISNSDAVALLDNNNLNLEEITSDFSSAEKMSIMSAYSINEDFSFVSSDLLNAAYDIILEKRFF